MPVKTNAENAPLCLRCPDKEAAEDCFFAVEAKKFGKCKGGKKTVSDLWRGFVDVQDATFDLTNQQCIDALNQAYTVDANARAAAQASGDAKESNVDAHKTQANAQFGDVPLSKQLLEHAWKEIYEQQGKKKAKVSVPIRPSGSNTVSDPPKKVEPEVTKEPDGNLLTNHFELIVQRGQKLFEYQVNGIQDQDLSASKKKVLLQRLIDASGILSTKKTSYAFNKEGRIIAWQPLNYDPQNGHVKFGESVPDYTGPNTSKQRQLDVEFKREIALDDFVAYAKGDNAAHDDSSIKQALDILIAHHVSTRGNRPDSQVKIFQTGDNKFFLNNDCKELSSWCMIAIRGFTSNVKAGNNKLLLNVNTSFSAFYKPIRVSEYLVEFQKLGHPIDKSEKARQHLLNKRVRIMYDRSKSTDQDKSIDDEKRRIKTITGFSEQFAKDQKFEDKNKKRMVSVWDFFKAEHPTAARNSSSAQFCVNTGSTTEGDECWYLPDQLEIVPGQMYRKTLDRLDSELTANMIDFACRPPEENRSAIMNAGLPTLGLRSGQPMPDMLQKAGISITPDMMEIPFRLVPRPVIQYGNGSAEFSGASAWKTQEKDFVTTHHHITNGIAFIQYGKISAENSERYPNEFVKTVFLNGIKTNSKNLVERKGALRNLPHIANRAHLVVLVVEGSLKETRVPYAEFRSDMDQKFGKPSIVLSDRRMKGIGNLTPYMASNAMKINIRLGNENHLVQDGFDPLMRFDIDTKTGKPTIKKCNTLVLGADLIHPKQGSAEFTPSIGALVSSVDGRFATFVGAARYQDAGQEYIEHNHMLSMAKQHILRFVNKTNTQRPRILYYRDGTGKTQFSEVRKFEIAAIRQAWEDVTGGDPSKLEITTVMVVKRHNTRFYPKPDDGKHRTDTGNCMPGTVVDTLITEPSYDTDQGQFDFYLQSHDVEKKQKGGTSAKPTHYFVRENGMKLGKIQLEDLTNSFCYNFAHSTNSVSYATPAYYADKLCERASLYLRRFYDNDPDVQRMDKERQKAEIQSAWSRSGDPHRKNPWHENLDDKMFWM